MSLADRRTRRRSRHVGVLAVALNVTATRTQGPAIVTGWPANTPMPATSSLNFVAAGRTVAEPRDHRAERRARSTSTASAATTCSSTSWATGRTRRRSPRTGGQPITSTRSPAGDHGSPPRPTERRSARVPVRPPRTAPPVRAVESLRADRLHGERRPGRPGDGRPDEPGDRRGRAGHGPRLRLRRPDIRRARLRRCPPAPTRCSDSPIRAPHPDLAGGVDRRRRRHVRPVDGSRRHRLRARRRATASSRSEKLRATFMHEIAHMVGLDHVGDSGQLMYCARHVELDVPQRRPRGLWRVGAAQGCLAGDEAPADALRRPVGSRSGPASCAT